MTIAYVYKWTNIYTFKWYIGSRTAKNCHPNDGYICSSKTLKPLIIANPSEWKRQIIFTGNPTEAYEFESMCLQLIDAKNDNRSYNLHNNISVYNMSGKKVSSETKAKMSASKKGKPKSLETRKKMSEAAKGCTGRFKGKKHNPDTIAKMSKPKSEETKLKMSKPRTRHLCPHCNKEIVHKTNHFDNCKMKT